MAICRFLEGLEHLMVFRIGADDFRMGRDFSNPSPPIDEGPRLFLGWVPGRPRIGCECRITTVGAFRVPLADRSFDTGNPSVKTISLWQVAQLTFSRAETFVVEQFFLLNFSG
jgi:hypothetical protein